MSGGDWFVAAIITLEVGAAFFYALGASPLTALMWLCLGLSNVFWLIGNTVGK